MGADVSRCEPHSPESPNPETERSETKTKTLSPALRGIPPPSSPAAPARSCTPPAAGVGLGIRRSGFCDLGNGETNDETERVCYRFFTCFFAVCRQGRRPPHLQMICAS